MKHKPYVHEWMPTLSADHSHWRRDRPTSTPHGHVDHHGQRVPPVKDEEIEDIEDKEEAEEDEGQTTQQTTQQERSTMSQQTTQKERPTMSQQTSIQGIGNVFRDRVDAATPRVVTTQVVNVLREPVVNAICQMGKIQKARRAAIIDFLATPQGDAIFRAALSVITPVIPIPEHARGALTRELQVSSLATLGDFVANVITAPVAGLLGGLFSVQETASKLGGQAQGVEVEHRGNG